MASVDRNELIVEKALCELAKKYETHDGIRTLTAFDRENGQYLLIDEGWDGYRRIHMIWAHVEYKEGKLWIHEDGTEEGIANLLVASGVPRGEIVLAFQAPNLRNASDFAVA